MAHTCEKKANFDYYRRIANELKFENVDSVDAHRRPAQSDTLEITLPTKYSPLNSVILIAGSINQPIRQFIGTIGR